MNPFILIITGIFSALATFIVNNHLKQGAVRASAGLSFIVGLFFYVFPEVFSAYLSQHIPIVFIGASFVGMVSSKVISNLFLIAVAGCVFSLLYLNTGTFFHGYGGALGTTACISVLVSISLGIVAKNKKLKALKPFKKKEE